MDTNYTTIYLNSSGDLVTGPINTNAASPDFNPVGAGMAGDFTTQLTTPMILKGKWECVLVSAAFMRPKVVPRSVFIYLDFLDLSVVGSNEEQYLFVTEPILTTAPTDLTPFSVKHTTTVVQWKPVNKMQIQSIRCRIVDTTGQSIPNFHTHFGDGFPSSVQFILRQVADE